MKYRFWLFALFCSSSLVAQAQHRPATPRVSAPQQAPAPITFGSLTRTADVYLRTQDAQNERLYALSAHNMGGNRNESEHIMLQNDSLNHECRLHYIDLGFYFIDQHEWSWIWWKNPALNGVKDYGTTKKLSELTTETQPIASQLDATARAKVAAYLLKAKGLQAIPAADGTHIWYVAIDAIDCDTP